MKDMKICYCLALMCLAFPLFAQTKAATREDFHAILQYATSSKAGLAVAPQYQDMLIPGIKTQFDDATGLPTFLWTRHHPEVAQSAVLSYEGKAREYLKIYAPIYGYSQAILDSARLRYIHDIGRGPIIAKFQQYIDGIEVFETEMNVNMTRDTQVVSLSGFLFPHDPSATNTTFDLDFTQVIAASFLDLNRQEIAPEDLELVETRDDYQYFDFKPGTRDGNPLLMLIPARVKKVLYGLPERLVPAYYIELNTGLATSTDSDYFAYVISAEDGSLLMRQNLTISDTFTYRVWANDAAGNFIPWDGPSGNAASPHPTGVPNNYQEPFQDPQLRTLQNVPFSMDDPWLAPGATETNGNNADGYVDIASPDGFTTGDFRAATTSANTFDYFFDHTMSPSITASRNAAITQLFYINNYLHDVYYEAGFDEAAGNAQNDNFGRGGVANDRIRAEGQDFGGTNNANMNTPADGGRPRMQMYIFTGPNPDRDGTIDNGISGHEWGHYWHHRLVVGANSPQASAMSEGFGDTIALIMQVEANGDLDGAYATGPYATFHAFGSGFENNFFFGIRRYAYSSDPAINALSFRHIGGSIASLPQNTPISSLGWENNGNAEVHNAGEIWCEMLWCCYHDLLVARLGDGDSFDDIKRDWQAYLVAGLKLTPGNTTFTQGRDGILAGVAATNPDDFAIVSQAFANKGIGRDAVAPAAGDSSNSGVVESFDPVLLYSLAYEGAALDDVGDGLLMSCDSDGILDSGETGQLTITLQNTSFDPINPLSSTTATVTSPDNVTFSNGGVINFPPSVAGNIVSGSVEVTLNEGLDVHEIDFNISFTDSNPDVGVTMTSTTQTVNSDVLPASTATDDVENGNEGWTIASDLGTQGPWSITEITSTNSAWFGPNANEASDQSIESPAVTVGAGTFKVIFDHRFNFESPDFDGGVIEITSNGGATWTDVLSAGGTFSGAGYTSTLTTGGSNPLETRNAFANTSAGYPNFIQEMIDFGTSHMGQTIQIRFRVGCDLNTVAIGWDVDNIEFVGIVETPFTDNVDESEVCASCFATLGDAVDAILDSLGNGDWPGSTSVDDYIADINNVCEE